ncbi:sensor histidine kinase [Marinobacterium arenosum]|uniref:sensor histidine kinase n=1 Tax=Marinobacterium arenosum TaxID=2862496 RepID=UPI001C93DB0A|nr:HAMP domain-containing sensor histidine kinase [Marinobacterium arenosum]MBY4676521.1 HAMP domain-containing histidine kinase [Marinobacterium arenosum]
MAFPEIEWLLAASLVLSGSLLFVAVWMLNRRGLRALVLLDRIYHLDRQVEQDLILFIQQLYPLLNAAGCRGLFYRIHWYGQPIVGGTGRKSRNVRSIKEQSDDIELELELHWPRRASGEVWIFNEVTLRTVRALIRMNMLLKQQSQLNAQLQASQQQLFLRHDIKNLAQFIQLQGEMLQQSVEVRPDDPLLQRLQKSSALAARQADKVLLRLQEPVEPDEGSTEETLELAECCRDRAQAFGVELSLSGSLQLALPRPVVDTLLDNLLSNSVKHGQGSVISVELTQEPNYSVARFFQHCAGGCDDTLPRLFEPFVSSSEQPGSGIGLYHCRTLLKRYGGTLSANCVDDQLCFELRLPDTVKSS